MKRISVILPVCIIIVSGCALFDGSEIETEKQTVSAPVIESVTAPPVPAVQIPAAVVTAAQPPAPPRTLSRDDVRRLQTRLRQMGFDPGPIDGVAGVRTKHAFERLRGGCARSAPLLEYVSAESIHGAPGGAAANGPFGREETIKLQTQLRSAGFNPGPVDGILGNKTKSALAQFHAGCRMAKEFDGLLDGSLLTAGNAAPVAKPVEIAASHSSEPAKPAASSKMPGFQEEVRILQLRLRDAGFDPGPFDGVMGPKTRLALERYEASRSGRKIESSLKTTTIRGQY